MGNHDIALKRRDDASARCPAFGLDGHIITIGTDVLRRSRGAEDQRTVNNAGGHPLERAPFHDRRDAGRIHAPGRLNHPCAV
jgi:hypothetical protein